MLYFTFVYFYSMSLNLLTETLKNLILNNSIQWSFHYFAMTMVKYDGDQRVYYKYKKKMVLHIIMSIAHLKKLMKKEGNSHAHILKKGRIDIKKNWKQISLITVFMFSKSRKQLYWIFLIKKKSKKPAKSTQKMV